MLRIRFFAKRQNVGDSFHHQSTQHSRQHPSHLLKILKFPFQKILNPIDSIPQIRSRPFSFIGFSDLMVVEQHLAFPGKQPIGVVGVIRGFQILHCLFYMVAEVQKLDIFNQSIHYQVDEIKDYGCLVIWCSWFIFIRRT